MFQVFQDQAPAPTWGPPWDVDEIVPCHWLHGLPELSLEWLLQCAFPALSSLPSVSTWMSPSSSIPLPNKRTPRTEELTQQEFASCMCSQSGVVCLSLGQRWVPLGARRASQNFLQEPGQYPPLPLPKPLQTQTQHNVTSRCSQVPVLVDWRSWLPYIWHHEVFRAITFWHTLHQMHSEVYVHFKSSLLHCVELKRSYRVLSPSAFC